MNTDDLINTLASDVKPVSSKARLSRLLLGIVAGGSVTLLLVGTLLGFRSDLVDAMQGYAFWIKWAYTVSLGLCALIMTSRLAQPESLNVRLLWPMLIPSALLAVAGVIEMAGAPSSEWLRMWLGGSWRTCPWLVVALSTPIFAGLLWSFRQFAPTRLRLAGAAAGLTSGTWGAALYCLHCPEVSAIFVLTWYSLGMLLAAGLGALVGPRLLRW